MENPASARDRMKTKYICKFISTYSIDLPSGEVKTTPKKISQDFELNSYQRTENR